MFPLLKYTAEEVDEYYAKVTPEMVRASLAKDRHDWFDLLNLVSPAAYPFMDEMRRKARLARIASTLRSTSATRASTTAGTATLGASTRAP